MTSCTIVTSACRGGSHGKDRVVKVATPRGLTHASLAHVTRQLFLLCSWWKKRILRHVGRSSACSYRGGSGRDRRRLRWRLKRIFSGFHDVGSSGAGDIVRRWEGCPQSLLRLGNPNFHVITGMVIHGSLAWDSHRASTGRGAGSDPQDEWRSGALFVALPRRLINFQPKYTRRLEDQSTPIMTCTCPWKAKSGRSTLPNYQLRV